MMVDVETTSPIASGEVSMTTSNKMVGRNKSEQMLVDSSASTKSLRRSRGSASHNYRQTYCHQTAESSELIRFQSSSPVLSATSSGSDPSSRNDGIGRIHNCSSRSSRMIKHLRRERLNQDILKDQDSSPKTLVLANTSSKNASANSQMQGFRDKSTSLLNENRKLQVQMVRFEKRMATMEAMVTDGGNISEETTAMKKTIRDHKSSLHNSSETLKMARKQLKETLTSIGNLNESLKKQHDEATKRLCDQEALSKILREELEDVRAEKDENKRRADDMRTKRDEANLKVTNLRLTLKERSQGKIKKEKEAAVISADFRRKKKRIRMLEISLKQALLSGIEKIQELDNDLQEEKNTARVLRKSLGLNDFVDEYSPHLDRTGTFIEFTHPSQSAASSNSRRQFARRASTDSLGATTAISAITFEENLEKQLEKFDESMSSLNEMTHSDPDLEIFQRSASTLIDDAFADKSSLSLQEKGTEEKNINDDEASRKILNALEKALEVSAVDALEVQDRSGHSTKESGSEESQEASQNTMPGSLSSSELEDKGTLSTEDKMYITKEQGDANTSSRTLCRSVNKDFGALKSLCWVPKHQTRSTKSGRRLSPEISTLSPRQTAIPLMSSNKKTLGSSV